MFFRKISATLILLMLYQSFTSLVTFGEEYWEMSTSGIKEFEAVALAFSPLDNKVAFAATRRTVYRSIDQGKNWRDVLYTDSDTNKIIFLCINPVSPKQVLAVAKRDLWTSLDSGKRWKKIFTTKETGDGCLSVAVIKGDIFLGTRKALFYSTNRGKTWQKNTSIPNNTQIIDFAIDKDNAYLATNRGVYKKKEIGDGWERISVSLRGEGETNDDAADTNEDDIATPSRINRILINPQNSDNIIIATSKGILGSKDKGRSWQSFSSVGFLDNDVKDVLISRQDGRLFAATKRGVYVFLKEHWQRLYQGLINEEVNAITEDLGGQIWLAGKGGVFKLVTEGAAPFVSVPPFDYHFRNEPTIQELQKAAIDYAEVAPEKIKRWRRQAQIKAIMPEVTLDFDRTVTTALGATYDKTAVGPQDWGVNLKWKVGELIWNGDQTSIDSRSKLMVELRDDIINELTRLYFERRRLQMEMVLQPAQSESERIEKGLRLEELTALIDGLTGGFLSKEVKNRKM